MNFFERLAVRSEAIGSIVCVGLGRDFKRHTVADVGAYNRAIIEATAPYVACYKPNIAFYEQFGVAGLRALEQTLEAIPAGIPVIGDVKRGDIGSTAAAYARAMFEEWKFDAITLNPYLGRDSFGLTLPTKTRASTWSAALPTRAQRISSTSKRGKDCISTNGSRSPLRRGRRTSASSWARPLRRNCVVFANSCRMRRSWCPGSASRAGSLLMSSPPRGGSRVPSWSVLRGSSCTPAAETISPRRPPGLRANFATSLRSRYRRRDPRSRYGGDVSDAPAASLRWLGVEGVSRRCRYRR